MKIRLLKPKKTKKNSEWMKGFILPPALTPAERAESEAKAIRYDWMNKVNKRSASTR